jgi:hypothetical protein
MEGVSFVELMKARAEPEHWPVETTRDGKDLGATRELSSIPAASFAARRCGVRHRLLEEAELLLRDLHVVRIHWDAVRSARPQAAGPGPSHPSCRPSTPEQRTSNPSLVPRGRSGRGPSPIIACTIP